MTSCFYVVSITFHTNVPTLQKCMGTSRKKSHLTESAATRAPPAAPLSRTWKTCLPSPLWVVQRRENHLGWGLASTADVEDTRRTDLGLLQQLNGQHGAEHCYVATKHLYSESTSFGLDGRMQVILDEIYIRCTGHSVPPGHVVLQNYPSLIPKDNQHNLSRRWSCAEFFRFWWGGMAPFLTRFLGFRLVVSGPEFHLQ